MENSASVWSQSLESCRVAYDKLLEENLQLRVKITKEFQALEASKAQVIRDLGAKLNENISKHNDMATQLNTQVCMQRLTLCCQNKADLMTDFLLFFFTWKTLRPQAR